MSNTLGTLASANLVSQRALSLLVEKFPLLSSIVTDFSTQEMRLGQELISHIPALMTASDYSAQTGYAAGAAQQSDVTVTLDQHPYARVAFNDSEMSSASVPLLERFAVSASYAIGQRLMSDIGALLVAANFSNVYDDVAASAFDWNALLAINKGLSTRLVPNDQRFLVLNPTAYSALLSEPVLVANAARPTATVSTGQFETVLGMKVIEWAGCPTTAGLYGFCGTPESIMLVTRLPLLDDKAAKSGGQIEVIREPTCGFACQLRSWYDYAGGVSNKCVTWLHGTAVGNQACLTLLKAPAAG
jgi:hypothetical protein